MSSRFVIVCDNSATNLLCNLKEPAGAQQSFSATREPTVWCTIPVLEYLQETWQNMAVSPRFDGVELAIDAGLNNLRKWYRKTDDTNAYFICLGMYCYLMLDTNLMHAV